MIKETVVALPKRMRKESHFYIDLNKFDIKDVLADDNGAYKEFGNKTKYFEFENNTVKFVGIVLQPTYKDNENIYKAEKKIQVTFK